MSRLGDLIRTERVRQKLTPKQVAKKCGVSESYLLAVEAGTRIIADDQARRILKTIGLRQQTEADFTLDDIAATVDLASVAPQMPQQAAAPRRAQLKRDDSERVATTDEDSKKDEGVSGSIWLDALSSVLKSVPVLNAVMKPVSHRLIPIENGRIEGAAPDKVFFYLVPDDSMRGFRIHNGDIALVVPAQSPVDGAVMLVEFDGHRYIRKVKKLDACTVLLQNFDREYESRTMTVSELNFLGRCVRIEFSLE